MSAAEVAFATVVIPPTTTLLSMYSNLGGSQKI